MPITTYALDLPGVAGSYASTPDRASFAPSGELTAIVEISPDDWTPSAEQALYGQWHTTSQRSWLLSLLTDGKLRLSYSLNGTAALTADSTAVVEFADGNKHFVRVVRSPGLGTITFSTSSDGSSYTTLGLPVVGTAGALHDSTAALIIGAHTAGTLAPFAGLVHSATLKFADSTKAAPNFNRADNSSFVDPHGNTWTTAGGSTETTDVRNTVQNDWEFAYNNFLFGGESDYGTVEIDGLDLPEVRVQEIDTAQDHGAFVFAEFFKGRRITVAGTTIGEIEDITQMQTDWKKAFLPRRDPEPLFFKLPGEDIKRIDCVPVRNSFKIDREYSFGYAQWGLQLIAGDPRIYESDINEASIASATAGATGVDFPADFPVSWGGGTSGEVSIVNTGIIATFPTIRVYGPAVNPSILHVEQSRQLAISGTVLSGEFIEFDAAEKTIKRNGTSSVYSSLNFDTSEWFLIDPGTNTIRFNAGNADANTLMTISWRDADV